MTNSFVSRLNSLMDHPVLRLIHVVMKLKPTTLGKVEGSIVMAMIAIKRRQTLQQQSQKTGVIRDSKCRGLGYR